jgi:hypothetical protein
VGFFATSGILNRRGFFGGATAFNPSNIAGLSLWLKADAGVTQSTSLLNGLLAYWKLDTDSWIDSSGNGIDLLSYSGVTVGTGIISGCALISPSGGYLDNSSTNFNVGTADISASVWIKPLTYGAIAYDILAGTVFDLRNGSVGDWLLIFGDTGKLLVWELGVVYESTVTISLNTWTHIAISRSSGTTSFYINGSLDGTFSDAQDFQSQLITIGGVFDFAGDPDTLQYDGNIDELGFWNRALSETEIASLYNAGAGNTYPFIDAGVQDVTAWADQSGNGNDATATDTPSLSTVSGKTFVDFAGGYFSGNELITSPYVTIMFVARFSDYQEIGVIFQQYSDADNLAFYIGFSSGTACRIYNGDNLSSLTETNNNQTYLFGTTVEGDQGELFLNGVSDGDGYCGEITPAGAYYIGRWVSGAATTTIMKMAEIVIYDRVLTTPERIQVEAYLNTKYAIY